MMRSMFSSVSSLRAHQAKMDAVANNIANVNTIGYKSSSTEFAEVFSQTLQGASSPSAGRGGTNPMQIGLGGSISSITVKHTQGSAQRTDNPLDLTINGDGFFVVTDDPNYNNKFYTRAGNFKMTASGYLTTPDGLLVLGKDMKPVKIDKSITSVGEATNDIKFTQNINFEEKLKGNTNVAYTSQFNVYDSLGQTHPLKVEFGEKLTFNDGSGKNGSLRNVKFTLGSGSTAVSKGNLDRVDLTNGTVPPDTVYAKFDEKGKFVGFVNIGNIDTTKGFVTSTNPVAGNALELSYQPQGADLLKLNMIRPDNTTVFDQLTHYSLSSDVTGDAINGKAAGKVSDFNISQNGEVVVTFTNGVKEVISTLSMAKFDNPMGLSKVGSNRFTDTPNSGVPRFSTAGASGIGVLLAGTVEMSNVDLSQEFTDMITTQRGFQANSRVITTSDEMLQELVNLKR